MNRTSSHRITVCTSCRHKGETCRPGYEMLAKLRAAIAAAGDSIPEDFEISGTASLAGCGRPCTVAYHATRKASFLFGDVAPEDDIANLVDFAKNDPSLREGWDTSVTPSTTLSKSSLARLPAAVMAVENSLERMS